MKPETDHPLCLDCDDPVFDREECVVTPNGVYHKGCDYPSPEDFQ